MADENIIKIYTKYPEQLQHRNEWTNIMFMITIWKTKVMTVYVVNVSCIIFYYCHSSLM